MKQPYFTFFKALVFITLAWVFVSPFALLAQKASATLDTTQIRIGEQIQLVLKVNFPDKAKINSLFFNDTLSKSIEIINRSKTDTIKSQIGGLNYQQTLTITSFDSGVHIIPSFEFSFFKANETQLYQFHTEPISFQVISVQVDTTATIRDIKAPFKQPWTLQEILPFVLIAIVICTLIAIMWYIWWRKRNNKPIISFERKPKLPAWQIALNTLKEISDKKLAHSGKTKQYYTELTDTLREYLSEQHRIAAVEMTSDEIMETYDASDLNRATATREKLKQVLVLADLVKFAKAEPLADENAQSLTNAVEFVIDTKPAETDTNQKVENSDYE